MPRQGGIVGQNSFIKGLITDVSALNFPPDACTDTQNCVFDRYGKSKRREGLNYDSASGSLTAPFSDTDAFVEFLWTAVAGRGTISFFVQQVGGTLYFCDASDHALPSENVKSFSVDLSGYIPSGGSKVPEDYPCSFASGNGDLIVCNPAIDPIIISYDVDDDELFITVVAIEERDLKGLEDGLRVNQRTNDATVNDLITSNPAHYYNLINQSWYVTDALSQWATDRSDLPSNADMVQYYRSADVTSPDAYTGSNVDAFDPGTTPAAKGHFILSAFSPDRPGAIFDEMGTTIDLSSQLFNYAPGLGSPIHGVSNSSGGVSVQQAEQAFNGSTNRPILTGFGSGRNGAFPGTGPSSASSYTGTWYIGKDFQGSAKAIDHAIIYGSNNQGFVSLANPSITITLYGSNTLPANGTDGTSLGSVTFTDTANESAGRTINSSDTTTQYRYIWVDISAAGANTWSLQEVQMYGELPPDSLPINTTERPSTNAFYASRVFYSGVDETTLAPNIYFTRIIQKKSDYSECYQRNDPTSEFTADLLPDDGGVIRIPEMGTCIAMFSTQSALIVLASNGVWTISGSSGSAFTAMDYRIKKISDVGTNAPLSVMNFLNLPIWWGYDGIYTVAYDANYESFTAQNLTLEILKTYYADIPPANRKFAKAAYDRFNNVGYWLFSTEEGATYTYERVLCLDGTTKAFYPWEFNLDSGDSVPAGIFFYADAQGITNPRIKYTIKYSPDNSVAFAEIANEADLPFRDFVSDYTPDLGGDYSSYFITGYRIDGKAVTFFQSNYVFVFLDTEDDASCIFQSIFDWTSSPTSGKWSTSQQLYNDAVQHRRVNFRRLKARGKGRALQLRFVSETGKPFTIIGWAIWETGNQSI